MLQPLGRHQVGRARDFAGRNRLLFHQVERTLLDDGRLLAQRDAQLQVAALHLTARGHAPWDTGRTCTPGWRFRRILFHHVDRWTNERASERASLCSRGALGGEGRRRTAARVQSTSVVFRGGRGKGWDVSGDASLKLNLEPQVGVKYLKYENK